MTEEERVFGFDVSESPTGIRAIVRELPLGLRAVKLQGDQGETAYAICDEGLHPLYAPAASLFELHQRFVGEGP